DGGATFGKNVLVYASPDGHVCECCHPSAIFDDTGKLHVMFRNWLEGNRDMWMATSPDGEHFDDATKLGERTWKLNACPMDGGALACDERSGEVDAAYRSGSQVLLGDREPETLLGEGTQPVITMTESGPLIAWTAPDCRLMLR